jgi:hypothetical protein
MKLTRKDILKYGMKEEIEFLEEGKSHETWIKHMKKYGHTPPEEGGDEGKWKAARHEHYASACPDCKTHFKTVAATRLRRLRKITK